jgi:hypothetical protein
MENKTIHRLRNEGAAAVFPDKSSRYPLREVLKLPPAEKMPCCCQAGWSWLHLYNTTNEYITD